VHKSLLNVVLHDKLPEQVKDSARPLVEDTPHVRLRGVKRTTPAEPRLSVDAGKRKRKRA
jgi:hypothetical protein